MRLMHSYRKRVFVMLWLQLQMTSLNQLCFCVIPLHMILLEVSKLRTKVTPASLHLWHLCICSDTEPLCCFTLLHRNLSNSVLKSYWNCSWFQLSMTKVAVETATNLALKIRCKWGFNVVMRLHVCAKRIHQILVKTAVSVNSKAGAKLN